MSIRLPRLTKGIPLAQNDLSAKVNAIADAVEKLYTFDGGADIGFDMSLAGCRARIIKPMGGGSGGAPSDSAPSVYMCKVVSDSGGGMYEIDIYGDGLQSDPTATGTMTVAALNLCQSLPVGTPLMILASEITYTGA